MHSARDVPLRSRTAPELAEEVLQFGSMVNKLKEYVNCLGTRSDNRDLRRQLQSYREECKRMAKALHASLQQAATNRQEKTRVDKVSKDFKKVVDQFEALSKESVRREKEMAQVISSSLKVADNPMAQAVVEHDQEELLSHFKTAGFVDILVLQEKEAEIMNIERDIRELGQLSKDLHLLVNEQGKMIDTIEDNVALSLVTVKKGTEELGKANTYSKRSRNRMCVLLLLLAVIALVLILVFTLK